MCVCVCVKVFPGGPDGTKSACNAENLGSIPELGLSPGEENGYLLLVFLPEEFCGQRGLVGSSVQGVVLSN